MRAQISEFKTPTEQLRLHVRRHLQVYCNAVTGWRSGAGSWDSASTTEDFRNLRALSDALRKTSPKAADEFDELRCLIDGGAAITVIRQTATALALREVGKRGAGDAAAERAANESRYPATGTPSSNLGADSMALPSSMLDTTMLTGSSRQFAPKRAAKPASIRSLLSSAGGALRRLNTWLQIVGMVGGLAGQYLINHKDSTGFVFWIVSNVALIFLHARVRLPVLLALHMVYLAMSVQGMLLWMRP